MKRLLSILVVLILMVSIFPFSAMAEDPPASGGLSWVIDATNADVSRIGTDNHVIKLTNLSFGADKVPVSDGILNITYNEQTKQRRIVAWTDLSGDAANVEDITFASTENKDAGLVVSSDAFFPDTTDVALTIPKALLYDGTNVAKTIYVCITVDNDDSVAVDNHRGAGEFSWLNNIALGGTAVGTKWDIGTNADVTQIGTDSHLMKISNVDFGADKVPVADALLNIHYNEQTKQRRIVVWTDLSGDNADVEDITFASAENKDAGKVISSEAFFPDTTDVALTIPKALLYDGIHKASALYIAITVDNDDSVAVDNHRGAKEVSWLDSVVLAAPVGTKWDISDDNAVLSKVGTDNHLMKVSGLSFDSVPLYDGTLDVTYNEQGKQRRIIAWTDLSGDAAELEDITFATEENKAAGLVASSEAFFPDTTEVSLVIPKNLLFNGVNKATTLYVAITVDNDDSVALDNHRGAAEFAWMNNLVLSVVPPADSDPVETVFTGIAMTPGADGTSISLTWFTGKDVSGTPTVLLCKKADMDGNNMPENAVTFTGESKSASAEHNTNSVLLSEIEPNTEYVYRVGNGTDWSHIYPYTSGSNADSFTFIAVGDPQITNAAADGETWKNTLKKAIAKAESASFLMAVGDEVDYGNDQELFDAYLAPLHLKSLPVAATVGNHEHTFRGDPYEQISLLPLHYNWPNYYDLNAVASEKDLQYARGGGDYFFSYGNALFIVMNSAVKDVEVHRPLVEQAIASHPDATWRIAMFHHDVFGVGDHAGTAFNDAQKMQPDWSPFMDAYNIDLAMNGHDHVYARSKFIKNAEIVKYQMPATLENDVTQPNAGTYVLPEGTLYMALASSGTDKMYPPEFQDWVAFTPGLIGQTEYAIVKVDGDSLTFDVYRTDTNKIHDSITLRKTASLDDLNTLLPGCEAVEQGDIISGWDAFQSALSEAKAVTESESPAASDVHNAYKALYDAYYALEVSTVKDTLEALIADTKTALAQSGEGKWDDMYPLGSKDILKQVLTDAFTVYDTRLATQAATDAAAAALNTALDAFNASKITGNPKPWLEVSPIMASGVNTIDAIDWMSGDIYYAYLTKQEFATAESVRPEPEKAPVNAIGGRGRTNSFVTNTHIGEWIRYRLNVETAGTYKVALGVRSNAAVNQKILLRDNSYNTLCTFDVAPSADWTMVSPDSDIYLPAGETIIELFFVNDGIGVNNRADNAPNNLYPDGADIDIITLERTGDGEAPTVVDDPSIFVLPLPPNSIQGAAHRQKGWANEGTKDDWGTVATGVSLETLVSATHLVLEVAAKPVSTNIQIHLVTDANDNMWVDSTPTNTPSLNMDVLYSDGKLTFVLADMIGYSDWVNSKERCLVDVSYYSDGWDELNVMKAYLILGAPSSEDLSVAP